MGSAPRRYTFTEALGNERARDRMDAMRQVEGLSQNEQIIELLSTLVAEQRRTNQLLEWLGTLRHSSST